jgi:rRNA maturation endonuclease Nob1
LREEALCGKTADERGSLSPSDLDVGSAPLHFVASLFRAAPRVTKMTDVAALQDIARQLSAQIE